MTLVENYSVKQVVSALRMITMSDKAQTLVRALATAPNRAMSRLELSRVIGSESVESCNASYGTFARNLMKALDPEFYQKQKDRSGDWVMCISDGPRRWTPPSEGERDRWVFVMSETVAQALDVLGFAPYQPLDEFATTHMQAYYTRFDSQDENAAAEDEEEEEDALTPPNPLAEIDAVKMQLESLSETERKAVIMARVGQGVFRQRLLQAWEGRCAVTDATLLPVLVASHIKPWMVASNEERLDAANGLLLVGTLDRLFDTGLITFEDDGAVRISPLVPSEDYPALGLSAELKLRHVPEASRPYLAVHRADFFTTAWDEK
jgi:hypothetical protein